MSNHVRQQVTERIHKALAGGLVPGVGPGSATATTAANAGRPASSFLLPDVRRVRDIRKPNGRSVLRPKKVADAVVWFLTISSSSAFMRNKWKENSHRESHCQYSGLRLGRRRPGKPLRTSWKAPFISCVQGDSTLERVTQRDSLSRQSLTGLQGEGRRSLSVSISLE